MSQNRRHLRLLATLGVLAVSVAAAFGLSTVWREHQLSSLRNAANEKLAKPAGSIRLVSGMEKVDEQPPAEPWAESVPDKALKSRIELQLRQMDLPVDDIELVVEQQRVTLEGEVDDPLNRDAIEVVARSVSGVHQVDNQIEVPEK